MPPLGWAATGDAAGGAGPAAGPAFGDLSGITALIEALRGTMPPELGHQLTEALRGLLVALRAVLDFYIARLERPEPRPVEVEDIPVE